MKNFIQKNATFLHKTLNGLADSLIKIFVPVIILKETQNIYLAILFMVVRPLVFMLFNKLLKKFLSKYPTVSIVIHIVPIVILQVLIFFVPIGVFVTIILAFLSGLFSVFYSVPANLLFVFSDKKLNVTKMEMGTNIGKIVFIVIGGFIINNGSLGFLITLIITASILYILSVLPLLFSKNLIKEHNIQAKKKLDVFDKKEKRLFDIYHIAFGSFQILIDEVLPVYLFFNGLNFAAIATLQAGIEVSKLFSNILSSYLFKKNLSRISVMISAGVYVLALILFLTVKNSVVIYLLSTLIGISFPMIFVPNFTKFCQKIVKKSYLVDELSSRDSHVYSGRPILIASYFVGFSFIAPFILAMVAAATVAYSSSKILENKQ